MTSAGDFPPLKNDLLLRVCRGENVERVPIWIMRQAGRYLPEYKEISAKHSFFEVCRTPSLACEVTLQPVRRYDLDAAIIFSDILVVPQALGMDVQMVANEGPVFPQPLKTPDDIATQLDRNRKAKDELKYVYEAISLTRKTLDGQCPLIGFSGAPWTLMSYMIEGKASSTMSKAKRWLYAHENESHELLKILANFVIDHLVEQIAAGAQLVQLFESHGAALTPELFQRYSLPYLSQISEGVRRELQQRNLPAVPLIVFAKDAHYGLEDLAKTNLFDVIGLDWTISASAIEALRQTNQNVVLQGNLDPCALYSAKDNLEDLVKKMLQTFGRKRYIANLGHGIYPDISVDNVQWFIDAVHRFSQETTSANHA